MSVNRTDQMLPGWPHDGLLYAFHLVRDRRGLRAETQRPNELAEKVKPEHHDEHQRPDDQQIRE
ncbi:hypothetical protein KTD12_17405 [Burkholderia multivorans]|uniref:hypothetical protein n=1 Tax=Burkholderia multivorans TaxID=87883 RepID=UPI0015E44E41|nr:hypothetical protein [Burkholderia multivorans]MBU9183848.1 hypothetical protein [Burkholderia multivorans]